MSPGNFFFVLCSLVALIGALAVVTARNPIRAAVGLLATILGVAGLFLMLHAQFLAAIQLIVYAGAVVVLFVFVIMLLGPESRAAGRGGGSKVARGLGGAGMAAAAVVALLALAGSVQPAELGPARVAHGSAEAVGGLIFSAGLVPFELTTALLIVAIVGAIAIVRAKPSGRLEQPRARGDHATLRLFGGPVEPPEAEEPPREERAP
jgi:NADH-quinone oxidoreductase subunit J